MTAIIILAVLVVLGVYLFVPSVRSAVNAKLVSWGLKASALAKVNTLVDELDSHAGIKAGQADAHYRAHTAAQAESDQALTFRNALTGAKPDATK